MEKKDQCDEYLQNRNPSSNCDTTKHNTLSAAIIVGDINIVRALLSENVIDVNCESEYFGRPLHLAARWGQLEILRLLISNGADPHTIQAWQPLMLPYQVYRDGKYPGTENDGSLMNHHGTPLTIASFSGHHDIVQLLITPVYKFSKSQIKESLLAPCRGDRVEIILILLARKEFRTRGGRKELKTLANVALYEASAYGSIKVVRMMLGQLEDKEGMRSDLPFAEISKEVGLEPAATYGHANIIRLLQKHGVGFEDLSWPFWRGLEGHVGCLKLLIGEEYVQNHYGIESLVERVIEGDHVPTFRWLVEMGLDKNALLKILHTSVNWFLKAAQEGRARIVRALLEYGFSPNYPDSPDSRDPVYMATLYNQHEVVDVLKEFGGELLVDAESDHFLSRGGLPSDDWKESEGIPKSRFPNLPTDWLGKDF